MPQRSQRFQRLVPPSGPPGRSADRPDDLVSRTAQRLAAARRERGLSQEGLAARLGIAVKNLQRMESGKQNLSLATVERVCRALDVPVESIFAGLPPAEKEPRPPRIVERLGAAGFSVRAATDRGRRPTHAVPVMTLRAAAGRLDGAARAIDVIGWVALGRPAEEGQFVAEVHGESMDPKIPNEALCLFGRPGPPPLRGHILLVAHESIADDELGGPFALKRLKSTRKLADGRTHVVLESTNKTFPPLVLDVSEGELRIVAELVRVLVP